MSSTTGIMSTATSTASATASCISVTPDKNGYVPPGSCGANYDYYPSFGGNLFFAIAFFITLVLHIYQATIYKKWKLSWVLVMGVLWELITFAARSVGAKFQQSVAPVYVALLILLAPIWVNAFVYMVLGRMIWFFVPEQKIWGLRGIKVAKYFVWLDVISFLIQLSGGMLINPSNDVKTIRMGISIYQGGIGFQEACIVLFLALATGFAFIMRKHEAARLLDDRPKNWRPLLWTLFGCLAFITMRIIYRLVEWAAGNEPDKNPIPFHEAYVFGLDALPMLLCVGLLNVVHPGSVLQGVNSEFPKGLTRREKKEVKRVKKAEKAERKKGVNLGVYQSV